MDVKPFPTKTLHGKPVLWAETAEEASLFRQRAHEIGLDLGLGAAFVGKRNGKERGNDYTQGTFYEYDLELDGARNALVKAPDSITDLVQWCACDVTLSVGDVPVLSIEDTTHLQGNNLFQRLPRVGRSTVLGIPAVTLQGIGPKLTGPGKFYALHRFMAAHIELTRQGKAPSVVLLYDDEASLKRQLKRLMAITRAALDGNAKALGAELSSVQEEMKAFLMLADDVPELPCITVSDEEVRINIGVRPDRNSWHKKGSGQMDTYVGLIYAAGVLFGTKPGGGKRSVVAHFKHLPNDFWWFKPSNHSLYSTLPQKFATFSYGSTEVGWYHKRPTKDFPGAGERRGLDDE